MARFSIGACIKYLLYTGVPVDAAVVWPYDVMIKARSRSPPWKSALPQRSQDLKDLVRRRGAIKSIDKSCSADI